LNVLRRLPYVSRVYRLLWMHVLIQLPYYDQAYRLYWHRVHPIYYRLRFGQLDLPIIFGNSFPKSGTNLLEQILRGFKIIGPFLATGRWINTYPTYVNRSPTGYKRPAEDLLRDIYSLLPGEIAVGHVHATPENTSALVRPGVVNYFLYRDPRDVVVSHAHWITNKDAKPRLHRYYTEVLDNLEERITMSILGVPDDALEFTNIRARFEPYLGWLELDQVMSIRFEDLIHNRERAIGQMINHLQAGGYRLAVKREEAVAALMKCVDPAKSLTFREGKTGGWRKHFTDEHKALFKEVAGDLLIRLGYEEDKDW